MKLRLQFTKLTGAGNDFVLIDRATQQLPLDLPELARFICQAHIGIGADGLVLFEPLGTSLFRIALLNPDGSEATTCGNAIRCAALYAMLYRNISEPKIQMHDHTYAVHREDDYLCSSFDSPKSYCGPIKIGHSAVFYIYAGTDHTVVFLESIDQLDVKREGPAIRHHLEFHPAGTNVNFAQIINHNTIMLRTYERGVEAETLSCGSGSIATTLLSRHLGRIEENDIQVINRSNTPLRVRFHGETLPFSDVWLSGPAQVVYEGCMSYESNK